MWFSRQGPGGRIAPPPGSPGCQRFAPGTSQHVVAAVVVGDAARDEEPVGQAVEVFSPLGGLIDSTRAKLHAHPLGSAAPLVRQMCRCAASDRASGQDEACAAARASRSLRRSPALQPHGLRLDDAQGPSWGVRRPRFHGWACTGTAPRSKQVVLESPSGWRGHLAIGMQARHAQHRVSARPRCRMPRRGRNVSPPGCRRPRRFRPRRRCACRSCSGQPCLSPPMCQRDPDEDHDQNHGHELGDSAASA